MSSLTIRETPPCLCYVPLIGGLVSSHYRTPIVKKIFELRGQCFDTVLRETNPVRQALAPTTLGFKFKEQLPLWKAYKAYAHADGSRNLLTIAALVAMAAFGVLGAKLCFAIGLYFFLSLIENGNDAAASEKHIKELAPYENKTSVEIIEENLFPTHALKSQGAARLSSDI